MKIILTMAMLLMFGLNAMEEASKGTLIVSYQTGLKSERLDRIRFILSDGKHHLQMYPKKNTYIEDTSHFKRMVIIDDLPVGEYKLQFIIPNGDGIFEELSPKNIIIEKDQIVKIDQVIPIRYASIKIVAHLPEDALEVPHPPSITLKDASEKLCLQSPNGSLNGSYLLPGNYTIVFEPLPGYQPPPPQEITLRPNESAGPILGLYEKAE